VCLRSPKAASRGALRPIIVSVEPLHRRISSTLRLPDQVRFSSLRFAVFAIAVKEKLAGLSCFGHRTHDKQIEKKTFPNEAWRAS
jgi:hypothetical protein